MVSRAGIQSAQGPYFKAYSRNDAGFTASTGTLLYVGTCSGNPVENTGYEDIANGATEYTGSFYTNYTGRNTCAETKVYAAGIVNEIENQF